MAIFPTLGMSVKKNLEEELDKDNRRSFTTCNVRMREIKAVVVSFQCRNTISILQGDTAGLGPGMG